MSSTPSFIQPEQHLILYSLYPQGRFRSHHKHRTQAKSSYLLIHRKGSQKFSLVEWLFRNKLSYVTKMTSSLQASPTQPPWCWHHKCVPPCPQCFKFRRFCMKIQILNSLNHQMTASGPSSPEAKCWLALSGTALFRQGVCSFNHQGLLPSLLCDLLL